MSLEAKRNEYLANLAVLNAKLHNLHWNVKGMQFMSVHEYTESLYDAMFERFDAVAEELKMEGLFPAASLAEYIKLASVEELGNKDYTAEEVLAIVKADLELMMNLALEIRGLAEEEDNFLVQASMEADVEQYKKNLWFIGSMLA